NLEDGFSALCGALYHLVVARIVVAAQVAHVRHVHHVLYAVAVAAQGAHQKIVGKVGAQVADVRVVVDGGAATVEAHFTVADGDELDEFPALGIEEGKWHGSSGSRLYARGAAGYYVVLCGQYGN